MSTPAAVVIGGASGLGRAIAQTLAGDGYLVTVADLDADGAAAVAEPIGGRSAAVDVTDEASVQAVLTGAKEHSGRLDAVVNTAGMSTLAVTAEHDVAEWRHVIDVNLVGSMIVIKHAANLLDRGGSIVSLTSLNARQPGVGLSAYGSAKAGLSMLTEVAALELGSKGIRVNAIAPGLVLTPLTEGIQMIPGIEEDYVENTPLGRAGLPEEIAAAASFLVSDKAAWITGEVMDINGGAHLMRYPNIPGHLAALGS